MKKGGPYRPGRSCPGQGGRRRFTWRPGRCGFWVYEALARGDYRQSRRILQESVALYRRDRGSIGGWLRPGYAGNGGTGARPCRGGPPTPARGTANCPRRRHYMPSAWFYPAGGCLAPGRSGGKLIRTAELYGPSITAISRHSTGMRLRIGSPDRISTSGVFTWPRWSPVCRQEVAEAALERGRQLDPWETAQALLKDNLPELGWEGVSEVAYTDLARTPASYQLPGFSRPTTAGPARSFPAVRHSSAAWPDPDGASRPLTPAGIWIEWMRSFIEVSPESHFSIQNLPYRRF